MKITISEDLKEGLSNYLEHGLEPGSYIKALINNDLRGAINNAHSLELEHLKDSIYYVDITLQKHTVKLKERIK